MTTTTPSLVEMKPSGLATHMGIEAPAIAKHLGVSRRIIHRVLKRN